MAVDVLHIQPLRRDQVDAAMRLSTQAGWNQCHRDWERLLTLWPTTCFAGVLGKEVVATATAACYDRLAWIGMVLVEETCRGHGIGRQIFEHVIREVEALGIRAIGLDATDLGQPLYERYGFTKVSTVVRWMGAPREAAEQSTRELRPHDLVHVCALDKHAHGIDRGPLMRALLSETSSITLVKEYSDSLVGYGIARPGREAWAIGPVVADRPATAASLVTDLAAALRNRGDSGAIFIDIPSSSLLNPPGFHVQRTLTRMTRQPSCSSLTGPHVFAAAGFELG